MTLLGNLHNNARALDAHTRALETAGHNLQNAKNPNYARQRVHLTSSGSLTPQKGFHSMGVQVGRFEHARSSFLDKQLIREKNATSTLKSQESIYEQLEADLAEFISSSEGSSSIQDSSEKRDGRGGLLKSIDDFFNAFRAVAASPLEDAQKTILLERAETLAHHFNLIDTRLESLSSDLSDEMKGDLEKANALLDRIEKLNESIARFEFKSPSHMAADFRDDRQAALEELSELMSFDVRTIPDSYGKIEIYSRDSSGSEITILDGSGKLGELSLSGDIVQFGSPAISLSLKGGSLDGYAKVNAQAVTAFKTKIDNLAHQFVLSMNEAYNPGSSNTDFFDATGLDAKSITLDASLSFQSFRTTVGAQPGANDIALGVVALADKDFSTASGDFVDGKFTDYVTRISVDIGSGLKSASDRLESQLLLESTVLNNRNAISGVSSNEEVASLLASQQAFGATARVMEIINSCLNVVVNELVRR